MSEGDSPGELPSPAPAVTPETRSFWAATAEGRLLLGRCEACDRIFSPPRSRCPDCLAAETTAIESSGRGTIYSYAVVRQSEGAYVDAGPYVLAYVELEEGPRIMTNVVGAPIDAVSVGQPVEVRFDDAGDGSALPRFIPSE